MNLFNSNPQDLKIYEEFSGFEPANLNSVYMGPLVCPGTHRKGGLQEEMQRSPRENESGEEQVRKLPYCETESLAKKDLKPFGLQAGDDKLREGERKPKAFWCRRQKSEWYLS